MKSKILLLLLLLNVGVLNAQDTIRTLIITEARMDHHHHNFVEITNVGDFPVQLGEFKFGLIRPWNNVPFVPESNNRAYWLPEKILQPGESYVMATVWEFNPKQFIRGVVGYQERITKQEIWDLADYLIHVPEVIFGESGDSVSGDFWWTWETQNGRGCFFLEHHLSDIDSVVVDQVGGVFDQENGLNRPNGFYDVAGVEGATGNSILVRKSSVKTGNIDFANARGVGAGDSEWMAIPIQGDSWRDVYWTLGNHGSFVLNESTLESDIIDVDFAGKTLTVPWGIRRLDDIMRHMDKEQGIAWSYHLNPNYNDSLYLSARTGDQVTIYVCGDELQTATFDIIVKEPANDANQVIPKAHVNIASSWDGGQIRTNTQNGIDGLEWPRVTRNETGIDTITGARLGLPFATRADSLLRYLEKAPEANWEFIWADGIERPDLKNGDKLKVIAQNGSMKEYFIQVQPYRKSINANLSAITWPDIPDLYRNAFGWTGDTIPGFSPGSFNYKVEIPAETTGIPALVAKTEALNSKVEVQRATSLSGGIDQRTVKFSVTAEDDTTFRFYNVELVKEKHPDNIQPNFAEPFLSQFVFWIGWSGTNIYEICNPGNQVLDLSNYMIVGGPVYDPFVAMTLASEEDDWLNRYYRYIPGYKWVSENDWAVSPGMIELDLNVNPRIMPGDVFVMSSVGTDIGAAYEQLDIDFQNNPWDEPVGATLASNWTDQNWFMFKILNDSITRGLKAANDPNDFELIETFGSGDGSTPYGWINFNASLVRRPENTIPKPGFKESFGTGWWHNSEWDYQDDQYWANQGVYSHLAGTWDVGKHYFFEQTHYKSTINSIVYKVSEGYSMEEEIRGVKSNTSVQEFFSNLIKSDEGQSLSVVSNSDGSVLSMDSFLSMNDTLVVLSADSINTTKYILEVTEEGLNSNAILTSTIYEVTIESQPKSASDEENYGTGTITGFEYGTQLQTILNNITIPQGAVLSIINSKGTYIPLMALNFDTTYVNVTVNPDTYFDVIAENAVTRIVYHLQPRTSDNDAFILSDIYEVSQSLNLINYIPRGTNVQTFLSNIVPSLGASAKLVDKMGFERTEGTIYEDDKIVVTSLNGLTTRVYHLSMLRTQYILETTYLAYVLSNVYAVDQVEYTITGPTGTTLLSDFYAWITPSMGATAVVVDVSGNEKNSGDLDDGDMLKVTSADGKIEVMYELKLDLTSVDLTGVQQIEIYPNPTTGTLNVRGVEQGGRIQIFNSVGTAILDIKVNSSIENISLGDQPSGLYMIVVSKDNKLLGRFKAVKQ
jgi:hypothetical protein